MLDLKNIDTLVFDIGNVIVDIDYDVLAAEFNKIATIDFHEMISYQHQNGFVDIFEKGQMTPAEFRKTLRHFLNEGVTDEQIDDAWNSVIVAYPPAKFDLLNRLRLQYRVVALSNINEIHIGSLDGQVQKLFGAPDLRSYFHQAYYSNELQCRKPDKEIYELLLQKEKTEPSRMLFIDDKAENTGAAAALGLGVYHLADRDSLLGLFDSALNSLKEA